MNFLRKEVALVVHKSKLDSGKRAKGRMEKGQKVMEQLKGSESGRAESGDFISLLVHVGARLQVSAVQQYQQVVHQVLLAHKPQKLRNVATLRAVRVKTRPKRVSARRVAVVVCLLKQPVALRLRLQLLADHRQQVQQVLLVVGV